jgi:hypothetical protein
LLVSTIASVVTYQFIKQKHEQLRQEKAAAEYFMAEESDMEMLLKKVIQQQSELFEAVKLQGNPHAAPPSHNHQVEDVLRHKRSETVETVADTIAIASEDCESWSAACHKEYVIVDNPKKKEYIFASDADLDSDDDSDDSF